MRTRINTLVCLALVLLFTLGACGGKKKVSAPPDSAATATSETTVAADGADTGTTGVPGTTAPAAGPSCPSKPEPTEPITGAGTPDGVLFAKIQLEDTRCAELVIFSFKSKAKAEVGYTAQYVTGPFTDAQSGAPIQIRGTAFIQVKFQPAYAFDPETGQPTYEGPKQYTPAGGEHVTQFAQTDAFEGVVTWVIGLDAKRPFAVKPGPVTSDPEFIIEIT